MIDEINELVRQSLEVKRTFFEVSAGKVGEAVTMIADSIASGGKVLAFGNGGSAADAQHIAAELVNRLNFDRRPIAAISLVTDTSILTSIANDSSFDHIFERQIQAVGQKGDIALAISTSGQSTNVLRAAHAARDGGLRTIALTGKDGGTLARIADLALIVEAASTQRIQETHITIAHIICELVEDRLRAEGRV